MIDFPSSFLLLLCVRVAENSDRSLLMAYQAIQVPSSGSSSSSGFQLLNSPFGDTTYTKVFVGGLAWETQSETMRRYFDQFGEILEAVVITDKNTGRSKGYGFVSILLITLSSLLPLPLHNTTPFQIIKTLLLCVIRIAILHLQ